MTRVTLPIALLVIALLAGLSAWPARQTTAGSPAIKNLPGCAESQLARNDDLSSAPVSIGFPVNFFGQTYTTLFVNNNGNVTFDEALSTYTPFNLLSTTRVIIAPFFGDVDTRDLASGVVTYGHDVLGQNAVFCANWLDVGYYAAHSDKRNSFQLLLIERQDQNPGDFDIMFNYGQIQWETGDASEGTNGLGGDSARVGYSNGVDTALELPGSAVNSAFLDSTPGGLIHGSRGTTQAGRYIFAVRSGAAPTGGFVSGRVIGDRGDGLNEPVAGAPVQICRQDVVPAVCSTTTTDANGEYTVAGLTAGTYNGVAAPPAGRPDLFPDVNDLFELGNNQGHTEYDFKLVLPRPIPPGVTVQSIATTSNGSPVINWSVPVQVTSFNDDCLGGSGTWELIQAGTVIASGTMGATATPGLFKGTLPVLRPAHGAALLHIEMFCPGAGVDKTIDVDVYIDPSGTVRTVSGDPVAGATVTLYRADTAAGPFEAVPDGSAVMSPSNRTNPDLTDAEGFFHWDVIAGYYTVRAEKAGCHAPGNPGQAFVETEVLIIPPPALDLDLRLDCGGAPGPTATPTPPGGGPTATPTAPGVPTATPRPPTPTPAGLNGDADCNRTVNAIDVALILQYVARFASSLPCQRAADVNGDGRIDSIDAALVLQYTAGLLDSL
jgi:hypothetical protein